MTHCRRCGIAPAENQLGDTDLLFCDYCASVIEQVAKYQQTKGATEEEAIVNLTKRYPLREKL